MFSYYDVLSLSAICYLLQYAILSASCILLCSFFWVIPRLLNFMCDVSEHSVCSIVIVGVSRTASTLCNFTMLSVSVRTQIGSVGRADHKPTTKQETGRTIVFPVTVPTSVAWSFCGKSFSLSVLHGELGYGHLLLQVQLMSDIQLFCCSLLIEYVWVEGFDILIDIWLTNQ